MGYPDSKFMELLKKRPRKIKVHCVFVRIPSISPPTGLTVYRPRIFGLVKRDHVFGAKVASPLIKVPFVTICKTALIATLRTKRRWRDFHFLIKLKVLWLYGEQGLAVLAGFGFGGHVVFYIRCEPPSTPRLSVSMAYKLPKRTGGETGVPIAIGKHRGLPPVSEDNLSMLKR